MTGLKLMLGASAVALMGCTATAQDGGAQDHSRHAAGHFKAEAVLKTAAGAGAGSASVQEHDGGLMVTVKAKGLPPGPHGVHVHMVGRCDAPDFTTAGSHWNPTAKQHGMENPAGPHGGDMPNLLVGSDGTGSLTIALPSGTFEGLLDEDGAAIVVHAAADDLKTDPSGNSGGRIACGVFGAV
jgi:Cu-Zn family superoxide dismutase